MEWWPDGDAGMLGLQQRLLMFTFALLNDDVGGVLFTAMFSIENVKFVTNHTRRHELCFVVTY